MRRAGFTLVELLVVAAMVGVLLSVLYAFSRQAQDRAELRAAAQQVANDCAAARAQAQHTSAPASVQLTPGGYRTSWGGRVAEHTLGAGARLSAGSSASSVTYSAPFGELASSVGPVWTVSSPRTSAVWQVRVVGVTGKVILAETD